MTPTKQDNAVHTLRTMNVGQATHIKMSRDRIQALWDQYVSYQDRRWFSITIEAHIKGGCIVTMTCKPRPSTWASIKTLLGMK